MVYHYSLPPDPLPPNYLWKNSDHYYDHPDGEQLFKKIKVMFRDSGILGLGFALTRALAIENTLHLKLIGIKILRYGGPFLCFGISFPIVAHTVVQLRGQRDHSCYAVAGFVSGALWSIAWGHPFYTGLGRAVLGAFFSTVWFQGHYFDGDKLLHDGYQNAVKDYGPPSFKRWADWGITPHRPGNWTRDPPSKQDPNAGEYYISYIK